MNKKRLLDAINAKKAEVIALVNDGKIEEAKAAKAELVDLQAQFDLIKDLAPDLQPAKPVEDKPQDAVHEFAEAARHGFRDAAVGANNEGEPASGGYTVPDDIQTRINHFREDNFSLFSLFDHETVSTNSGRRTYQSRANLTGFSLVTEAGKIGKVDGPAFEVINYNIKKYAGFLPVTNELLADSDANITSVLTTWLARQDVATRNKLALALLNTKPATAIKGLDDIKKIINVTLGQLFAPYTTIVTNDDGMNYLDTLKDSTGAYLLKPNRDQESAMPMQLAVGARRVPIMTVPDSIMPSDTTTTSGKTIIPLYIGDFNEAGKIFDRQKLQIMSSNVAAAGSFNAFEQDMTMFRGIVRLDMVAKDPNAFVHATLTV
jgi:HK97 family phage major capsid protein